MTKPERAKWKKFLTQLEDHICDNLVLLRTTGERVNRMWGSGDRTWVEVNGREVPVEGPEQFRVYRLHEEPFSE